MGKDKDKEYVYHICCQWQKGTLDNHYYDGLIVTNTKILDNQTFHYLRGNIYKELEFPPEEESMVILTSLTFLGEK